MGIKILTADYQDKQQAADIVMLLDAYASDPMGGGKPLSSFARDNVVAAMAQRSGAFSLVAYVDNEPAGLVNCFEGFSTFACKPLLNIHDFVVMPAFRGKGVSQRLLAAVEDIARAGNCCKLTLEVLGNNEAAKAAYKKYGFAGYELDPKAGAALFWQKNIE